MTEFDLNIIEGGWAHEEVLFIEIPTQQCWSCKRLLQVTNFYHNYKQGGYITHCSDCARKKTKIYRTYHLEECKKACNKYKKSHPDVVKKNWEDYYKNNHEEVLAKHRLYNTLLTVKEHKVIYNKNYREEHKDREQEYNREHRTGWSKNMYIQALQEQKSCCAICGLPSNNCIKETLHSDHDHSSNVIRGLLCHKCNCALGMFDDNQDLLYRAILYLIFYKKFGKKDSYIKFDIEKALNLIRGDS